MSEKPNCGCVPLLMVADAPKLATMDRSACLYDPNVAARIAELEAEITRKSCEFCDGRRYWVSEEGAEIICDFCSFDRWTPTSGNVNALPKPLRAYIHDIETKCDPAGDVRTIAIQEENLVALQVQVDELAAKAAKYDAGVAAIQVEIKNPANDAGIVVGLHFALRALGAEPQEEP